MVYAYPCIVHACILYAYTCIVIYIQVFARPFVRPSVRASEASIPASVCASLRPSICLCVHVSLWRPAQTRFACMGACAHPCGQSLPAHETRTRVRREYQLHSAHRCIGVIRTRTQAAKQRYAQSLTLPAWVIGRSPLWAEFTCIRNAHACETRICAPDASLFVRSCVRLCAVSG
jgi:hypothetical protein